MGDEIIIVKEENNRTKPVINFYDCFALFGSKTDKEVCVIYNLIQKTLNINFLIVQNFSINNDFFRNLTSSY